MTFGRCCFLFSGALNYCDAPGLTTHQVCRPPEEHGVQVAFLEALVQRGGAAAGQRSEGVCVERSRCAREIKLHGQVRNQRDSGEGSGCFTFVRFG